MEKKNKSILFISLYFIVVFVFSLLLNIFNIEDKAQLLIKLIIPLVITLLIYYIINLKIEAMYDKIKLISKNYKKLEELNNKYDFKEIKKTKRNIYEREYSNKSYDRARAKSIILYQLENNEDSIREFILDAYRNKKMYDKYIAEFEQLNEKTDNVEIEKIGFKENKFNKLERKIINQYKISDKIYKISIKVTVEYISPYNKENRASKSRVVEYQELCDLYMEWRNGKKYAETSKRERSYMSDDLRFDVLKRDNYKCKICGIASKDGAKLHVDHIVPVSKGGKTTLSNLQTLCDRCNKGKSDKNN